MNELRKVEIIRDYFNAINEIELNTKNQVEFERERERERERFTQKRRERDRERKEEIMFGSVVAVAFQSVFHLKMNQNNIFFILKKLFLTSAHQNNLKTTKKILI